MASALPLVRRREAHAAFALSTDFDYTACTCDAYRDASAGACQRGKYAKIRESLDHAYHGVYTAERQALQDRLVDAALEGSEPQAQPRDTSRLLPGHLLDAAVPIHRLPPPEALPTTA